MVIENVKPIGWSSIYNLNIASPFFVKKDDNKKTIIDKTTRHIVERIFNLYLEGNIHQQISNIFNKEKKKY